MKTYWLKFFLPARGRLVAKEFCREGEELRKGDEITLYDQKFKVDGNPIPADKNVVIVWIKTTSTLNAKDGSALKEMMLKDGWKLI